ncbi:MAG: hypothetical protein WD766_10695 [Gemmatimonadota bacterium]
MVAWLIAGSLMGYGAAHPSGSAEGAVPQTSSTSELPGDTTQVLLSLVGSLEHPDARATIIRPVGEGLPDMIFVTPATSAADLEGAVQMLFRARESFGTSVDREMRAHVPAATEGTGEPEAVLAAEQHLAEVRGGEDIEIPGFGPTKYVLIKVTDAAGVE